MDVANSVSGIDYAFKTNLEIGASSQARVHQTSFSEAPKMGGDHDHTSQINLVSTIWSRADISATCGSILKGKTKSAGCRDCGCQKVSNSCLNHRPIMPELNGPDLARLVSSACPGIKIIFIPGYTSTFLLEHDATPPDTLVLEKPFTPSKLAPDTRLCSAKSRQSRSS